MKKYIKYANRYYTEKQDLREIWRCLKRNYIILFKKKQLKELWEEFSQQEYFASFLIASYSAIEEFAMWLNFKKDEEYQVKLKSEKKVNEIEIVSFKNNKTKKNYKIQYPKLIKVAQKDSANPPIFVYKKNIYFCHLEKSDCGLYIISHHLNNAKYIFSKEVNSDYTKVRGYKVKKITFKTYASRRILQPGDELLQKLNIQYYNENDEII